MQQFNFSSFLLRQNNSLDNLPLFKILSYLPKPKKDGPWIAGGAIRRTLINQPLDSDIDYFFKTEQQFVDFDNILCQHANDIVNITLLNKKETSTNCTYDIEILSNCSERTKVKLQAIKIQYYQNIEEVLNSFDYTICQFAYDGESLFCGDMSLWDLARKRLVINNITYAVASLRRLIKYTNQGFYACQGCLSNFLNITLQNPSTITNDIKYID